MVHVRRANKAVLARIWWINDEEMKKISTLYINEGAKHIILLIWLSWNAGVTSVCLREYRHALGFSPSRELCCQYRRRKQMAFYALSATPSLTRRVVKRPMASSYDIALEIGHHRRRICWPFTCRPSGGKICLISLASKQGYRPLILLLGRFSTFIW